MNAAPLLIVDDHPVNLKVLKIALESEGYEIRTAPDAETALAMLEAWTPGAILMDIQLPGMDGLELTRKLKADPVRSRIPVIAVSAYAMKGDEDKALAAGCDGYVTKPVNFTRLYALLDAKLGGGPAA